MDLMDSIYVPSKYPVYSALPQALPDPEICRDALTIARKVKNLTTRIIKGHIPGDSLGIWWGEQSLHFSNREVGFCAIPTVP